MSCARLPVPPLRPVKQYTTLKKGQDETRNYRLPNPARQPVQRAHPQHHPTDASAGRMEVHTLVVDVPDPRVDRLSAMFKPRKTIYAKVTYADIAGLEGTAQKRAFPARC